MIFLFGLLTGILVTFAFASAVCLFMEDDDIEQMQAYYESNYGKENENK